MVPILPVTIAHGEEMTVRKAQDVRVGDIGVLILFVRIIGRYASFRCKAELGYNIRDLLAFLLFLDPL